MDAGGKHFISDFSGLKQGGVWGRGCKTEKKNILFDGKETKAASFFNVL